MAANIIEDLLSEILNRLPLKTVLQCASVCKSWYSFITSHRFINRYNPLEGNVEKQVILYGMDPNKYYFHKDDRTLHRLSEFNPLFGNGSIIRNVGFQNGLICMDVRSRLDNERNVFLWNPTIRRFFQVPKSDRWGTIGFGFIPETNDYKIVNIGKRKADVYELGSGSWKDVKHRKTFFIKYKVNEDAPQCFLNDVIHWVGCEVIVTFNVKKNKLGKMMMPSGISSNASCIRPTLHKDSLAVMEGTYKGITRFDFCIWVVNEYDVFDSWTKHVTIGFWNMPLMYRHNSEVLLAKCRGMMCDLLFFDPKNRKLNKLVREGHHIVYADYFVPKQSLLLLDKPVVYADYLSSSGK